MQKVDFSNSVSETLLINLYFRSLENKMPEPILKDNFSQDIVKNIDYDFSKFDKSKLSRVGCVIRSRFFDDEILKIASENKNVVVVQVGAGLDTRPLRLCEKLKGAYFYDIDLSDVINLREKLVKKAENNFYIAASMLDSAWMDELLQKHKGVKFIFVLEGISMYFSQDELKGFFINLLDRFDGVIMLDCLNKFTSKMNTKRHDTMKFMKRVEVKFGIDSEDEILAWDKRISFIKKGVMIDMYKNRWGFLGFIFRNFIPVLRNTCNMYLFKLN